MKQFNLVALFGFGLLMASSAYGAVSVHSSADFPHSIQRMAVAPMPCGSDLNCKKVEKHLNKSVQKYFSSARIIDTDGVEQALFDKGYVEPTKDHVMEVAKELGADSVLFPGLIGSERKDHWNVWTEYDSGKMHATDAESVQSAVQILIMKLDGGLLLKGEASGESYLQTDQTYFAENQFDKILRKALK